jgi:hypothetical protein
MLITEKTTEVKSQNDEIPKGIFFFFFFNLILYLAICYKLEQ